jgi:hypothetical protein
VAGPLDFPDGAGWIVTGQDPDQVIVTNAGRPVTGTMIYFATGEGNTGSIFVDDGHYHPKPVHAALSARAALIDEIGQLSSAHKPK